VGELATVAETVPGGGRWDRERGSGGDARDRTGSVILRRRWVRGEGGGERSGGSARDVAEEGGGGKEGGGGYTYTIAGDGPPRC